MRLFSSQLVLGLVCVASFFVTPLGAKAATLYFDPGATDIHPGDTISLALRIDTDEGECINVVDAVIQYDPRIIPVDVSRGNSIMPIWVEDPVIDTETHTITLAGGIPNGYCGRIAGDPRLTNTIVELLFQAPAFAIGLGGNNGQATVQLAEVSRVLLNDGEGTPANLRRLPATFNVQTKPRSEPKDDWLQRVIDDDIAPQPFSVTLSSDASIFAGRYFVTFNTTDKESGIDHYEIMEEPLDEFALFAWGAVDAPWRVAESPYLLKDQSLNSVIRVKAIDKAGNEYIAVYVPEEGQRGLSTRTIASSGFAIAGFIMIVVALAAVLFYRRRLQSYNERNHDS